MGQKEGQTWGNFVDQFQKKVQSLVAKADENILRDISELEVDPKEGV